MPVKTIMDDPSDVQARALARGPWRVLVQPVDPESADCFPSFPDRVLNPC
jgi:hypothetical protein